MSSQRTCVSLREHFWGYVSATKQTVYIIASFLPRGTPACIGRRVRAVTTEPLRVVGLAEIAGLLNVSKRTATRYTTRGDFPQPAARLAMGPIWRTAEIEQWIAKTTIRRGRPRK